MANVAYVRVSTQEQNEARQIEALKGYGIDRWYTEKVSAKDTNRPQLQAMLEYVREGDTIYIHDFSRLARNTFDLLKITQDLKKRGINLKSNKEGMDTNTPTGELMLKMIAAINDFERQNLLDRQREGIAIAKSQGRYAGRRPVEVDNKQFIESYNKWKVRELSKSEMAKHLKISRPTLDKLITEYEAK